MKNFEVANDVVAFLEEHPDQHKQDVWRCQTGMCFAGWTAERIGLEWENKVTQGNWTDGNLKNKQHVSNVIQEFYGFTIDEADCVFDVGNTVEDIKWAIKTIADGKFVGYYNYFDRRPSAKQA